MSPAVRPASGTSVEYFLSTSRPKLRRLRRQARLRRSVLLGAVIEKAESLKRTQPGAYIPCDGSLDTPRTCFTASSTITAASSTEYSQCWRRSRTDWCSSPNRYQCLYSENLPEVAAAAKGERESCRLNESDFWEEDVCTEAPVIASCVDDEESDCCYGFESPRLPELTGADADLAIAGVSSANIQREADTLPSFEELFYAICGRHYCDGTHCSNSSV